RHTSFSRDWSSDVCSSDLFYQVLQELTGFEIEGDHHLVRLMRDLAHAKTEYDKFAEALAQVDESGYGIVAPRLEDISFDEPEIRSEERRVGKEWRWRRWTY